jgi:translation initiation factor 1 (eIF-1/SUI1)
MAKKGKPDSAAKPPESTGLKHNPFAALAGQLPSAPTATTPVLARTEEGAPRPPSAPSEQPVPVRAPTTTEPTHKGAPPAARVDKVKSRGRLILRRETKHRGGKAVIIVRGFAALPEFGDETRVAELAKELKQKLGCGGTVEHGDGETEIVLQGDRAAKVAELLRAQGFRVDGVTS